MRAAVVREYGGQENVRVESIPRPTVAEPDGVVIRVGACSLNRLDVFARLGLAGPGVRTTRLPHVSGVDVAGEVVETGPGVRGWQTGDRVVSTRPSPAGMVVTVGELRPHEKVLVLGAGGGVGVAAVQMARRIGAHVFGVTSGNRRVRRLSELGANRTIDRATEDFEEVVARETGGAGVGLVVNPVGGSTWRPAIRSLEPGGRMTICGATIGDDTGLSIREVYQSHRRILGAPLGNRRDFRAVLDLLCRGELDPVVDIPLPLESISEAHRMIEENEVFGKVVLVP